MNQAQHAHKQAMRAAIDAYQAADFLLAYLLLERAHILGQFEFLAHWRSHWWMLKVAKALGDRHEIKGQVRRLAAVIPGYIFGWVPVGNTGRSNVSALKPMPLPSDLARLMDGYSVRRSVALRILGLIVVPWLLSTLWPAS